MNGSNELSIIVRAKDEASKVLDSVKSSASKMGDGVSGAMDKARAGSFAALGAVTAVGAAGVAFGASSVKAYMESENAAAQLEAVLKSTGGAAGITSQELQKQATALQGVTKFSDEAVMATQSMLLTFTGISGKVMPEATKAALDMAQALGMDGKQAAMQLGKALNDPTTGMTKLQRVGVTFTDEQKKAAEQMVKTGDVAGAQALILAELKKEFGGSAEAAGKTFAGKLEILKNTFGDLQESVGKVIVNALLPLANAFSAWITKVNESGGLLQYFTKLIKENEGTLKLIAGAILGAVVPALIILAGNIWATMAPLIPWMAAGAALAFLIDKLVKHFGGWSKVLGDIKKAFETGVNGIKAFFAAFKDGDVTSNGFVGAMEKIGSVLGKIWQAAKPVVEFIGRQLMAAFKTLWDTVKKDLLPALERLWPVIKIIGAVIVGLGIAYIVAVFLSWVAAIWLVVNALKIIIKVLAAIINYVADWVKNMIDSGKTIVNALVAAWDWIVKAAKTAWKAISDAWNTAVDGIKTAAKAVSDFFKGVWDAIYNVISTVWKAIWTVISFYFNIIKTEIQIVAAVINYIWQWIVALATAAWNWLWTNVISPVYESIKAGIQTVSNFIQGIWNAIVQAASVAWNWIYSNVIQPVIGFIKWEIQGLKNLIDIIWNGIVAGAQWLGGILSGVWNWITSAASNAWNGISGAVGRVWGYIQGVWNGAIGWLSGIWNSISNGFSNAFSRIGGAVSGAFEGVKGAVVGGINWIIDKINGFINKVNSVADKVPGAPHIGNIGRLAGGAQDWRGGMAMVGEQGREAVYLPPHSKVMTANQTEEMASGTQNNFYGTINLNTPAAVDRFYERFNRDGELASLGVPL